jgi:uncharacterized protein YndB with AHSA1/START domain
MTTAPTETAPVAATTTAVFKVYIRTTPEAIWQAITDPEWTVRYGYGGYVNYDLRPGGALTIAADEAMKAGAAAMGFSVPDVIIDGEILVSDPPRLLRTTWRMLMEPTAAADDFTTITYEIEALSAGYCALTVTHDCANSPTTFAMVTGSNGAPPDQGGGGWPWILSDIKSLLETGSRM